MRLRNNPKAYDIMEENSDGFIISEKDFLMRGSGDLFGVKQSGDMNLKIADIKKDFKILLRAKDDSMKFLKSGYLNNYNLSNLVFHQYLEKIILYNLKQRFPQFYNHKKHSQPIVDCECFLKSRRLLHG